MSAAAAAAFQFRFQFQEHLPFFKGCCYLVAFIDHFTHLYKIVRHQLSYMQLNNTQHNTQHANNLLQNMSSQQCMD